MCLYCLISASLRSNDVTDGLLSVHPHGTPQHISNAPPSYWNDVNTIPPTRQTNGIAAFCRTAGPTPRPAFIKLGNETLNLENMEPWKLKKEMSTEIRDYTLQSKTDRNYIYEHAKYTPFPWQFRHQKSGSAVIFQDTYQTLSDWNNITPAQ